MIFGAGLSSKLVEKVAPRLAVPGLLIGGTGMLWLSRRSVNSSYFGHVMPGVFQVWAGLGASARRFPGSKHSYQLS